MRVDLRPCSCRRGARGSRPRRCPCRRPPASAGRRPARPPPADPAAVLAASNRERISCLLGPARLLAQAVAQTVAVFVLVGGAMSSICCLRLGPASISRRVPSSVPMPSTATLIRPAAASASIFRACSGLTAEAAPSRLRARSFCSAPKLPSASIRDSRNLLRVLARRGAIFAGVGRGDRAAARRARPSRASSAPPPRRRTPPPARPGSGPRRSRPCSPCLSARHRRARGPCRWSRRARPRPGPCRSGRGRPAGCGRPRPVVLPSSVRQMASSSVPQPVSPPSVASYSALASLSACSWV